MSFVVKKRDLTDPAQLQALIVEHADDLERGLTVLDSRFLLGQATIDVVGLDADGALVLIAVGLVADEEMFLRAVEAYSWCLEYPDAVRRLYPAVQFSSAHPPRVMFVVERMPDAFHRKIKQLGFPEVDCVEFRHLDVDGTAAVYFDTLAHLRRGAVATVATPDPTAAPPAPTANGRPTRLKLQKLLGADRSAPVREPAPVVRMVPRAAPRPESTPTAPALPTVRPAAPNTPVEQQPVASRRRRDDRAAPPAAPPIETPPPPVIRVSEPPRVTATVAAPPAPPLDVAPSSAVAEMFLGVPEALAQGLDAANEMVEPFARVEMQARNGHAEPAIQPEPTIPQEIELSVENTELAGVPVEEIRDVVAAEIFTSSVDPVVAPPLTIDEIPTVARELERPALSVPEPEPAATTMLELDSRPTVEPELTLELESRPIVEPEPEPKLELEAAPTFEADLKLELAAPPTPEPELKLELEAAPTLETELKLELEAAPTLEAGLNPELEAAPTLEAELKLELESPMIAEPAPSVTEPEPAIAALSTESLEPVVPEAPTTSAPSVFSRRPPEAAAARDAKVSFAGMANELLPQNHRAPAPEPPVSVSRASVEEITRGALEDLVGATEKRTSDDRPTAFAKPGGAFAKAPSPKRPRTIAPPPSDGQPIAGAAKLGSAPKRADAGAAAAPTPADGETPQAMPEGFEGLQFPNDGVLTRQWMEFLNQMAAGK
jgi:hypothetical protein